VNTAGRVECSSITESASRPVSQTTAAHGTARSCHIDQCYTTSSHTWTAQQQSTVLFSDRYTERQSLTRLR